MVKAELGLLPGAHFPAISLMSTVSIQQVAYYLNVCTLYLYIYIYILSHLQFSTGIAKVFTPTAVKPLNIHSRAATWHPACFSDYIIASPSFYLAWHHIKTGRSALGGNVGSQFSQN